MVLPVVSGAALEERIWDVDLNIGIVAHIGQSNVSRHRYHQHSNKNRQTNTMISSVLGTD